MSGAIKTALPTPRGSARVDLFVRRLREHGSSPPIGAAASPLELGDVVRPDLRFHYANPIGAERWLDVCRDPRYGHDTLIEVSRACVPKLLLGDSPIPGEGPRTTVVSLGPGDGALDTAVMDALDEVINVNGYVGVDSSTQLLQLAAQALSACTAARRGIPFELIEGDFLELTADDLSLVPNGTPRLFLLLGLTFGNYSEVELLSGLTRFMRPHDLLLFDARVHTLGADGTVSAASLSATQRDEMLATYDREESRRFAFSPVEALTTASVDEFPIRFEIGTRYTDVPGALCIVTYCEQLSTVMRESGLPVHLSRLDLGVTSAYDPARLVEWLPQQALRVVAHDVTAGTMRVLAKRA